MKSFYITRNHQQFNISHNVDNNSLFLSRAHKDNKVILSTTNMGIGFLHADNKIYEIVEIHHLNNQYAFKSLVHQKYFSSRPLQGSEASSPFNANGIVPKDLELFDLSPIEHEVNVPELDLFKRLNESVTLPQQRKHIIISIRYSILLEGAEGWAISRNVDYETYKSRLFSNRRLSKREEIFKSITLPSLQNIYRKLPYDTNLVVYLLSSEELPQKHKDVLLQLQQENPFLRVKFYKTDASISQHFMEHLETDIKKFEMYASVRLDDDDAVSSEWLSKVLHYLQPAYNNKVLALSGGVALSLDHNSKIIDIAHYSLHFAAAGLAYIGQKNISDKCIFHCGNHTTVYKRFETIFSTLGCSFGRSYNNFNDSEDPFPKTGIIPQEQRAHFLAKFGLSE